MPLDGSNNYYYPLGTPGVPNQTIESEKYNTFLDDLVMNDLNVPRPVSRGGTGASTPEEARTNLGVMSSAGGPMNGSIVVTGTITASLGPSVGVIYLGSDGVHYLNWDGASYNLPSGPLAIGGNTTITGGLGVTGNIGAGGYLLAGGTSNTGIVRFGHETANFLYFNGTDYILAGGPLHVGAFDAAGATTLTTLTAGTTGLGATTVTSLAAGPITCGVITASGLSSTGNISSNGSITCDAGMSCNNLTTGSLTVGGNAVWHAGNFNPASYLPLSGGTITGNLSVTGDVNVGSNHASQGKVIFTNAGRNLNFNITNSDGWRFQGGSSFHIDGTAWKPGGGSWDPTVSDLRVKNVLGEYSRGLDQIKRLKPQRYKFKGNDGDTHKQVLDKEFVGLVAQDVETVMPEMVIKIKGKIDDKDVDDLRRLDTNALIYALINSVRELSNRVEELESAG